MNNFLKYMLYASLTSAITMPAAIADGTISFGKNICRYRGNLPRSISSYSAMDIYHNEPIRITGTESGVNIWKGTGDVLVVFAKPEQERQNTFLVNGFLQTCRKY